jgi:hypothetical protein
MVSVYLGFTKEDFEQVSKEEIMESIQKGVKTFLNIEDES